MIGEVCECWTVMQLDIGGLYNWKISKAVKMHVSVGIEEGMLEFQRWPQYLHWVINLIKEKKAKEFLFFFMLKI